MLVHFQIRHFKSYDEPSMGSSLARVSRRRFIQSATLVTAGIVAPSPWLRGTLAHASPPLAQFDYGDVVVTSDLHEKQRADTHAVLLGLSEDSLLKPFREMSGKPAPGDDLGGWYHYDPNYDWHTFDAGFATAATFGQWVSALSPTCAITSDREARDKVLRLNRL